MIVAICWTCGAQKVGAFTRCTGCGTEPRSSQEKAKSLLLSEQCRSVDELSAFGAQIAAGSTLTFDEAEVARVSRAIEMAPKDPSFGCRALVWLPVVILVLLGAVVVALLLAGAFS